MLLGRSHASFESLPTTSPEVGKLLYEPVFRALFFRIYFAGISVKNGVWWSGALPSLMGNRTRGPGIANDQALHASVSGAVAVAVSAVSQAGDGGGVLFDGLRSIQGRGREGSPRW